MKKIREYIKNNKAGFVVIGVVVIVILWMIFEPIAGRYNANVYAKEVCEENMKYNTKTSVYYVNIYKDKFDGYGDKAINYDEQIRFPEKEDVIQRCISVIGNNGTEGVITGDMLISDYYDGVFFKYK